MKQIITNNNRSSEVEELDNSSTSSYRPLISTSSVVLATADHSEPYCCSRKLLICSLVTLTVMVAFLGGYNIFTHTKVEGVNSKVDELIDVHLQRVQIHLHSLEEKASDLSGSIELLRTHQQRQEVSLRTQMLQLASNLSDQVDELRGEFGPLSTGLENLQRKTVELSQSLDSALQSVKVEHVFPLRVDVDSLGQQTRNLSRLLEEAGVEAGVKEAGSTTSIAQLRAQHQGIARIVAGLQRELSNIKQQNIPEPGYMRSSGLSSSSSLYIVLLLVGVHYRY